MASDPSKGQVEHLNPEGLPQNPAFTNVVVVTGPVRTIYIGGQDAVDATGQIVGAGDIGAQTDQVFANIQTALEAAGAGLEHVVKWNVLVVQGQSLEQGFAEFQRVWGNVPTHPPSRPPLSRHWRTGVPCRNGCHRRRSLVAARQGYEPQGHGISEIRNHPVTATVPVWGRSRSRTAPRKVGLQVRMTKLAAIGLSVVLSITVAAALAQDATPAPVGCTAGSSGIGDPYYPLLGNSGYDVQHYTLDLDLDVAGGAIADGTRHDRGRRAARSVRIQSRFPRPGDRRDHSRRATGIVYPP